MIGHRAPSRSSIRSSMVLVVVVSGCPGGLGGTPSVTLPVDSRTLELCVGWCQAARRRWRSAEPMVAGVDGRVVRSAENPSTDTRGYSLASPDGQARSHAGGLRSLCLVHQVHPSLGPLRRRRRRVVELGRPLDSPRPVGLQSSSARFQSFYRNLRGTPPPSPLVNNTGPSAQRACPAARSCRGKCDGWRLRTTRQRIARGRARMALVPARDSGRATFAAASAASLPRNCCPMKQPRARYRCL